MAPLILDVAVAVSFAAIGAFVPGRPAMRALIGATGAAWMLATWIPDLNGAHQGILLIALALFPGGTPRSGPGVGAVVAGLVVAIGIWPQPIVALVFTAVGAVHLCAPAPRRRVSAGVGAVLVATVLSGSWFVSRWDPSGFQPHLALALYEASLLATAALLAVALLRLARPPALTDVLLHDGASAGLTGLEVLLRDILHDPALRIVVSAERASIESTSSLLDDVATRAAVDEAVLLAARHAELTIDLARQRVELEAARPRLVDAAERRRAQISRRLSAEVVLPLAKASKHLQTAGRLTADAAAAAAIDVAAREADAAARDVFALVRGAAPVRLGNGMIVPALEALLAVSGPEVHGDLDPAAAGTADAETALYYACSEAVTNALRHASAASIDVTLSRVGDELQLTVADDGRGGARPSSGSGLEGLADRLSARGGNLHVESRKGQGTVVRVRIPVRGSAAAARS